jgi:hypothetical protein
MIFATVSVALAAIVFAMPAAAADRSVVPEMFAGAPTYVRFSPIFTPIIQGNRVTSQIGVTLMLQLNKGEDKDPIEEKHLQLNNAFVEDLYAFFQQHAGIEGGIDQMYLKDRLLKVADNVIGKDAVQEVLIEQMFEEPK